MRRVALSFAILTLFAGPAAIAQDEEPAETAPSKFVGQYDGSAMETAMGMILREDGTFAWFLAVGGLDLRAAGTWVEEDGKVLLTSDPKPVPPEFRLLVSEERTVEPVLTVQTPSGRQLDYIDIRVRCADEVLSFYEIPDGGLILPEDSCPELSALSLELPGTAMEPQIIDLAQAGWERGMPLTFEFQRNDLGVADFTGMTGQLIDGELVLRGGRYDMELRQMSQ